VYKRQIVPGVVEVTRVEASRSGSSVVVNVTAPVADAAFAEFMGRELERLFGAGGLRTSTVIG
jgi:hypothetical protein